VSRVLILHIPVGSGHTRAATAIAAGIARVSNEETCVVKDAFRYINRAVAAAAIRMYMDIIRITPAVWNYVYRQSERSLVAETGRQELASAIRSLSAHRILRLVDETMPDTIVCTHPFPLGLMAELKRRGEIDTRLIGAVTDFTVHPFWLYDEVDHYSIAADSLLVSPSVRGLPDERVWVTGIPIDPRFGEPQDRMGVREAAGYGRHDRVVLVMGGGLGLGPVGTVVRSVLQVRDSKVIVVAGKNANLAQDLETLREEYPDRLRVFGFVGAIHTLMCQSDVLISKAGGLTAAEAVSQNLPLIILSPIPGQEQRNTDFLINHGAAVKADSPREAASLAATILERPRLRNAMLQACAVLGRPSAAEELAKLILGR